LNGMRLVIQSVCYTVLRRLLLFDDVDAHAWDLDQDGAATKQEYEYH